MLFRNTESAIFSANNIQHDQVRWKLWNTQNVTLYALSVITLRVRLVEGPWMRSHNLSLPYIDKVMLPKEIINNYSSSPNELWVNSPWGRRPNGLLTQRPWGLSTLVSLLYAQVNVERKISQIAKIRGFQLQLERQRLFWSHIKMIIAVHYDCMNTFPYSHKRYKNHIQFVDYFSLFQCLRIFQRDEVKNQAWTLHCLSHLSPRHSTATVFYRFLG